MKIKWNYLILGIIVLAIVLGFIFYDYFNPVTKNKTSLTCDYLKKNFDLNHDFPTSADDCKNWNQNSDPVWVGGKLINLTGIFRADDNTTQFNLTFQGYNQEASIFILSDNGTIPYQIGNFYKFDMTNKCYLLFSAENSGMFYDPDFNYLEKMDC